MFEPLAPLEPLILPDSDPDDTDADVLLPVQPRFFVPRLREQPQDPILNTLKSKHESALRPSIYSDVQPVLPPELVALAESWIDEKDRPSEVLWTSAMFSDRELTSKIKSWDALRSTFDHQSSPGPFLSEQSNHLFSSARYHVDPRLLDPTVETVHASTSDVLETIKILLLGNSSLLYTWNPISETFDLSHTDTGKTGRLVLDGRDEVVTQSFIQRFINIGTHLRRLEIFCENLREGCSRAGPTINAYTHSLSSCVDYLRKSLAEFSAKSELTVVEFMHRPSATWMHHAEVEIILSGMASLCHRDISLAPDMYPSSSQSSDEVLSDVYNHLMSHIERDSPRTLIAMLAYILTTTSDHYLLSLGESVGYTRKISSSPKARHTRLTGGLDVFNEEDNDAAQPNDVDKETSFPTFITKEVESTLVLAKKSLALLKAAQPDHPLLKRDILEVEAVRWFWTADEVEAAWTCVPRSSVGPQVDSEEPSIHSEAETLEPLNAPLDLMSQFAVFSFEPGTHLSVQSKGKDADKTSQPASLQSFLQSFPSPPHLPSLTPTLPHLTSLVLSPLLQHCTALSRSLLSLFLDPSSHLNLHSHLTLLRSFILLTSTAFKNRLKAALFSDSDDWKFEGSEARAIAKDAVAKKRERKRSRKRTQSGATSRASSVHSEPADGETSEGPGEAVWAVGLGLGLRERNSWPPGGSDLSFYLRTVIVDSLESHAPHRLDLDLEEGRNVAPAAETEAGIWAEAETRLGFAIRDLPAGTGRERWLNPCSIESLDFLYVDYKPPHPLDVIITGDALSKYQRMFSFILRLLRVQSALNALFRLARDTADPLFPTLSGSTQLLLNLRFISHSFVDALSTYVFDTAIRSSFDSFLARLRDATPDSSGRSHAKEFTDIFALSDIHSTTLDSILSACLLRTSQRAAGDLLRTCLESILELCILAGEIKRRRIKEYNASIELEELGKVLRERIRTFVMVLKTLVDKGTSKSNIPLEFLHLQQQQHMNASSAPVPGRSTPHLALDTTASLYHLLVKLDATGWWRKAAESRD